jgi:MFS family permease
LNMSKTPRIGLWFLGAAAIFFSRAFMFSSWVSRGPEAQAALDINTAQMGLLSMLYPAGGLAGILFSSWLVHRFGSKLVNTVTYVIGMAAFFGLGQAVAAGDVFLAAACLFVVGFPMAISDFVGNFEATNVNRAATKSLLPAIHGSFGVGMLAGASAASWLIEANISLSTSITLVAIFVVVISLLAGFTFPKTAHASKDEVQNKKRGASLKVWTEKRTLLIAVIGFAFVMAEMSAGTWVPIALSQIGFTDAAAAAAFSIFWVATTITRLLGGYITDLVGRQRVILISAIITAIGMLIFINSQTLGLPYLGLVLWGLGMALGFPMSVMAMGDDEKNAPARVNMIISVVYIASVTVGPALGSVGQLFGIYVAFGIPLVVIAIAAVLSPVTRQATSR